MNALAELSGATQQGVPLSTRDAKGPLETIPFPNNAAVERLQPIAAGSESGWHQNYIWYLTRKPAQRAGLYYSESAQALWQESRKKLMDDVSALKSLYAFRNEAAIVSFFATHAAVIPMLANAAVQLKHSFGQDAILYLECFAEDDEPNALYAIVVWRGNAERAEAALEDFDERWWLNQDAQPGIAFTYELA